MAQGNNPFAEAFKAWNTLQFPSAKESFEATRQGVEAFAAANQIIAEGAQAATRRQVELAQKNAEEAIELFKQVAGSKNPETSIAKQVEYAKGLFESSLANSREILEMSAKSNSEAFELLGKQLSESVSQFAKANQKNAA